MNLFQGILPLVQNLSWCTSPFYRFDTSSVLPLPNPLVSNPLQKQLKRVLDDLLELADPLSTDGTVNNLVVEAGGDGDLVLPLNTGGAVLVLDGNSDLLGGADGEDGGLRGVDNGSEVVHGRVHAHVGDGDGTALVLLGLELVVASLLGQLLDLAGDGLEATGIDTSDNRSDEAVGGGDGNGDINGVELADGALAPAGVGGRDLLAGDTDGLDEEIVDGQLVLALRGAVERLAELHELADGQAAGDEEVRVLLGRLDEAAGNGLAHAADGEVLEGGAGSGDSRAGGKLLDVLLVDAATLAGTLDVGKIDALLASEAQGRRGSVRLTVESGLETTLGRSVLLGLGRGGLGRLGLGAIDLSINLLILLGRGRGLGLAASILDGEFLEGSDIGALLDENGDWLTENLG